MAARTGDDIWGERTPYSPGQARSDLDIWLDYARRMGFTDRNGRPLPPWDSPKDAFDALRECSRCRPCDSQGKVTTSFATVRESSGRPPMRRPNGTDRLYVDHHFMTDDDQCGTYGHDLVTGGEVSATDHAASRLSGRAPAQRRGAAARVVSAEDGRSCICPLT